MVSLDLRAGGKIKIKDGRHVGLDFYDLLIEGLIGSAACTSAGMTMIARGGTFDKPV
jgi:hypothetical protein